MLCTPPAFILSQDQTLWSLYIHWGSPQSTSSLRVIQFAQLLFRVSLLFFKRIFEFLALCAKLNFFSFVVVQFSKIRRFPLPRSALLVYHFVLSLSTPFFKFFKKFFMVLCWHWLIFPGRFQPSIVSTGELNFRVRNGNGWTLTVKSTNYGTPSGTRTLDTLIKSQVLYQLS